MTILSTQHKIFSNFAVMTALKTYFSTLEWERIICALRNPLGQKFELCYFNQATNIVTIGDHYDIKGKGKMVKSKGKMVKGKGHMSKGKDKGKGKGKCDSSLSK